MRGMVMLASRAQIDWAGTIAIWIVVAVPLLAIALVVVGALWYREREAQRKLPAQAWAAPAPAQQGYAPPPQGYGYAPMAQAYPAPMAWTCPFCRYQGHPAVTTKVTTAGWVLFALMLCSCIGTLFCWAPLLLTRRETSCSSCRTVVGGG